MREACEQLAALGLIRDSGERRDGEICWVAVPGKEAEMEAAFFASTVVAADQSKPDDETSAVVTKPEEQPKLSLEDWAYKEAEWTAAGFCIWREQDKRERYNELLAALRVMPWHVLEKLGIALHEDEAPDEDEIAF
jgi:hypothetical protein